MRHPGCSQNKQTPQRSTEVRAAELYHNTKHITHIFSHTRHHQLLQPNPNPSNHPTKRRSEETQRVSTISLLLNIIRLSSPEPPSFEGGSRVPEHSTSFQIASRRLDRHLKHRPQRKARQHIVLELTLLILEKVPTEHLSKLRRVSKKWNDIISSIGYAVKPIFIDSSDIFPYTVDEDIRYELDVAIEINPAINSSAELPRWPCDVKVALESVQDPTQLLSKRQQFITSPPIKLINLGLRERLGSPLHFGFHESTAMLRDNTGIRIGLLLDTFNNMRALAVQPFQHDVKMPLGHAFRPVAYFRYSGTEVVTYLEKNYTEYEWDFEDSNEDQESKDGNDSGQDNEVDGGKYPAAVRPRRSVVHCPVEGQSFNSSKEAGSS